MRRRPAARFARSRQGRRRTLPTTEPLIGAWDETFAIGSDAGTPVDDQDYQVPFAFTGKLDKITVDLGGSRPSPAAIREMMKALAEQRDR